MVLVLDVGNTNIVLGVYESKELIECWRLSTDVLRTADEYGTQVTQLFLQSGLELSQIEGVIISSVVPDIMYSLEHMIKKYLNIVPIVVGPGIKTGINIKYDNPKEVGADRIVNAVAAYEKYKRSLIIIDYGTATTFCAITKNGDYLGGAITPGIKIATEALFERAAKLPRIELIEPEKVIGKSTISSMQSGVVYGYIGQIKYMVSRIAEEMMELGEEKPYVIATGGFANLISKGTGVINEVEPFLTLEGLRIIYDKNKK